MPLFFATSLMCKIEWLLVTRLDCQPFSGQIPSFAIGTSQKRSVRYSTKCPTWVFCTGVCWSVGDRVGVDRGMECGWERGSKRKRKRGGVREECSQTEGHCVFLLPSPLRYQSRNNYPPPLIFFSNNSSIRSLSPFFPPLTISLSLPLPFTSLPFSFILSVPRLLLGQNISQPFPW